MKKLSHNDLYILPHVGRGGHKKGGKREIISLFRLGRFVKKEDLRCSLHGDRYAYDFCFRIKATIKDKQRLVHITVDCDDKYSAKDIENLLFDKIELYDLVIHGKTEEDFNSLFNNPEKIRAAELEELKN